MNTGYSEPNTQINVIVTADSWAFLYKALLRQGDMAARETEVGNGAIASGGL